jgi:hypothetical protein
MDGFLIVLALFMFVTCAMPFLAIWIIAKGLS